MVRLSVHAAMANNVRVVGIANDYEGLVNGEFHPRGTRNSCRVIVECKANVMINLKGIIHVRLDESITHATLGHYDMVKTLAR